MKSKIQIFLQERHGECGLICLKMIAYYHGIKFLDEEAKTSTDLGISLSDLEKTANHLGFQTLCVCATYEQLLENNNFPLIAYWKSNHYVLVTKVTKSGAKIIDPLYGDVYLKRYEFINGWVTSKAKFPNCGIAMYLKPLDR